MTMLGHIITLHFALCFFYAASHPVKEACKDVECPGPVKFYKELECKPVYKNPDDCCAIKYDCAHLENRSPDKCYANGKEYNIGERHPDAGCGYDCHCGRWRGKMSDFICSVSDYAPILTDPGCYRERNATECFPGPQICPENPKDIPKCMVNGKLIDHGEYFEPEADKYKICWCGPGYDGKNVEPYCLDTSQSRCRTEVFHRNEIEGHCAPVYREYQSLVTGCNFEFKCQADEDEIIRKKKKPEGIEEENSNIENMFCRLGKLTMQIGDELKYVETWGTNCVKCSCDVPPVPTCQYIHDDVCDRGHITP